MAKKSRIWNFFDNLKGDKVVWMIVMILIMISGVCIFSSTSMEPDVLNGTKTRIDVAIELLATIGLGIFFLLICYNFIDAKWYRILAQGMFVLSVGALGFVLSHLDLGIIKAAPINGAWRVIKIKGVQIHVYEAVKVGMVMYMAWAADQFNNGGFTIANKLSKKEHFHWLKKPFWQKCFYIYGPMLLIMLMIVPGSGSSALFIGILMFATVLVGGLKIKELIGPALIFIGLVAGILLLNKAMDGRLLENTRIATWSSRLGGSDKWEDIFNESTPHSKDWQVALDKLRQPYSAKIAIKEGGIIGKGPGQSTQRYVVPVMYEDYMYSFILEEYGLLGGIAVLILYISLLARGSVITKNCNDKFGKNLVAGLVIMITGQAMLHMMVNAGIMPLTGQTLPLISYGTSSFVMFCIAFGMILSISRDAKKKIDKMTKNAEPLVMQREGIQGELDSLDDFESGNSPEDELEEIDVDI